MAGFWMMRSARGCWVQRGDEGCVEMGRIGWLLEGLSVDAGVRAP